MMTTMSWEGVVPRYANGARMSLIGNCFVKENCDRQESSLSGDVTQGHDVTLRAG